MVVAAAGAISLRWWARYLIFALSALYVGIWVWTVGPDLLSPGLLKRGAADAFLLLLPLNAFLAMACYWAYVAAVHLKNRDVG
jgi:hypothetical protein